MYVKRIEDEQQLRALRDGWNELARDVPWQRWDWLANWWSQYGRRDDETGATTELCVLAVYASQQCQELLGLAPWYIDRSWSGGHVVRFLGDGEVCTDYASILCRPEHEQLVAGALADWLTDAAPDVYSAIELSGFAVNDTAVAAFSDQLALQGHEVYTTLGERCWRIELPDSWNAFLASLSKSRRKQARQAQRRYLDTGRARAYTADRHDFAAAFEQFATLHQHRRDSLGQRGCFDSPRFDRFLRAASHDLLEAGLLRLNLLELDGRVVAADLNLAEDGVLYAYQGGVDPTALADGPGHLLTMQTIRWAIENNYRAYDLLRGDEAYKVHWHATACATLRMRCVRRMPSARVRQAIRLAGEIGHRLVHGGPTKLRKRVAAVAAQLRPCAKPLADHAALSAAARPPTGCTVRAVRCADELDRLRADWKKLAGDHPLRSIEWLGSWWRHFGAGANDDAARGDLLVLVAEDASGETVGIAPWYVAPSPSGSQVIRFLGTGIVCTDYQAILCRDGHAEEVAHALAGWLADEFAGHWHMLELTDVDTENRVVPALVSQLGGHGYTVHRRTGETCWRVPLPDTWDAYVQGLSSSMRAKVRQIGRKYFETGRATIRVVEDDRQLEEAFEIFRELHQKRRESLGDVGCFSDPAFADFLRETARGLLASGQLDMLWLELDGRPVAVEFQPIGAGTTFSYQGGIEPEALHDRPGYLMNIARVQCAIQRGDSAFDFLRGDESYKRFWNGKPVSLMEYRIRPNRPVDRLRHHVWQGEQQARAWARQGRQTARQWQQAATSAMVALFAARQQKPSVKG